MVYFLMILSIVMTLGICWLIDRESMAYHTAATLFFALCVLFWVVFPTL